MVDRTRPLKIESPSEGGTQEDFYPTATNPNEDYLDAHGITIQDTTSGDDDVRIDRDSDEMILRDKVASSGNPITLQELLESDAKSFEWPFTSASIIWVPHARGAYPLVQVILPISGFGWNVGGWNQNTWNTTLWSGSFQRLPDDQYTLEHHSADLFKVTLASPLTGKVVYF